MESFFIYTFVQGYTFVLPGNGLTPDWMFPPFAHVKFCLQYACCQGELPKICYFLIDFAIVVFRAVTTGRPGEPGPQ